MSAYSTPFMEHQFSDEQTLVRWAAVERAVLRAQAAAGLVPQRWADLAEAATIPSVRQWQHQTSVTGHEMIGFLRAWGVPHVHIGLTSSDVIDTAQALLLKRTGRELISLGLDLREALVGLGLRHMDTPRLGRTHGQAAVPDTFGHHVASLAFMVDRSVIRLQRAAPEVQRCKISGPTGAYHHVSPEIEAAVADELGLASSGVNTQIVARDSLAHWIACVAGLASVCEAVAIEVRLGAHDGVGELEEGHGHGWTGSSAMPHKSNPTQSERICGLARVVRAAIQPLMAGIPQWHERDLAHSSVERLLVPQVVQTTAYMLVLTARIVRTLKVDTARMHLNLDTAIGIGSHTAMYEAQVLGATYEEARAIGLEQAHRAPGGPDLGQIRNRLRLLGARPLPDDWQWTTVPGADGPVQVRSDLENRTE